MSQDEDLEKKLRFYERMELWLAIFIVALGAGLYFWFVKRGEELLGL